MRLLSFIISTIIAYAVHVPTDYPTIQDAIDAVSSGDSVLVLPGSYCVDFNFSGKDVHIESTDGPDSTLIYNCNITISQGESRAAVLKGFSINGIIEYYQNVIEIHDSDPTIKDNVFCDHFLYILGVYFDDAKNGCIIGLGNSSALIEGNSFIENDSYWDSYYMGGDYSILRGYCVYIDNETPYDTVEIRNNHFINNDGTFYSVYVYGYCVYATGNVLFENNLFHNNGSLTNWYDKANTIYCEEASEVSIINSTFFENGYETGRPAIRAVNSASCEIRNCIVWENTLIGPLSVEYSDVQSGYSGTGNIDEDPLFVTGLLSDCHLGAGSPCIDSGDPDDCYLDPEDPDLPGYAAWPAQGSTLNDMGVYGGPGAALWTGTQTSIEQIQADVVAQPLELLSISPNPSRSAVDIELFLSEASSVSLYIYDTAGHIVHLREDCCLPAGINELFCNSLCSGVYFCRIMTDSYAVSGSFAVLR